MYKIRISILILILVTLVSCKKNDEYDGEVTFYTNAQALLNCGPFDVYVYINDEKVGTLSQPLPIIETDPKPKCGDPLTFTIKKKKGDYSFSAEGECGFENLKWEGEFQIVKDSCTFIGGKLLLTARVDRWKEEIQM